jgi:hypothetical protein
MSADSSVAMKISPLWLILLSVLLIQDVSASEASVVQRVVSGVKKGGEAVGRGIEKGAEATGRGLKKGANATAKGVKKAEGWVGKKMQKGGEKLEKASE